jgi:hypothetical protein
VPLPLAAWFLFLSLCLCSFKTKSPTLGDFHLNNKYRALLGSFTTSAAAAAAHQLAAFVLGRSFGFCRQAFERL